MKVSLDQLIKSEVRYNKYKKEKIRPTITEIDASEFLSNVSSSIPQEIVQGNIIGDKKNLLKRKEMLSSSKYEPLNFAYERAIGKNDSVYSNFVELILEVKKKVGRIVVKEFNEINGYATGFLISDNLLLTNWHVFKTKESVGDSVVQFNYELDTNGNPTSSITFNLSASTFYYSFEDLDYCIVAVEKSDVTGSHDLSGIGYIFLDPTLGKLGNEDEESLNIIHHPNGDYKQLSIRENKFKRIMSTSLWYESDTAQGSSGGPVFNDQWQVVALHHMGVAKKNENGEYLDKNNQIIPVIDNEIDVSKVHWIANEGIRISVIRKHLQSVFPNTPLIFKIFNQPNNNQPNQPILNNDKTPILDTQSQNQIPKKMENSINISIPSEILEKKDTINVNITTKDFLQQASTASVQSHSTTPTSLIEEENYKLERETSYVNCRGYRSDFLGSNFRVAIPKPLKTIKNQIAKISGTNAYILKYYKFSVIFNALNKMPLISCINVDGDEDKRKDFTDRYDRWIRDNRIDFDCQLDNKFYTKSGFDRGHMSRREDANWGETPSEAKRNADLTCVHTNACPQVPELNRSNRGGIWGKLEKLVLEYGAKKENGKTGKISVFNGPIFKNTDPIYKGVKIPMEYFKIVIWLSDNDEIKATAFKLSQADLVGNIDFEDLGIDQDVKFKEYQCSLSELQKLTNIDFEDIKEFDTYKGNKKTIEIKDENHLIEMIKV
ncbi:trypsin-like serine protease [Tenacibaculum aiptasiae]|uniref:Serine protease n=1 Tax=Tenacibaculum aiptasiae TaxID=426481 RepID=A0A7J5AE35_9FLAO|nr:DNA/RNA non-specific endonuclease [Tenacibaculum aiptasiae]KAB1155309.1 trypsin-like serine protease [Tenacibaculum aiptasiae]